MSPVNIGTSCLHLVSCQFFPHPTSTFSGTDKQFHRVFAFPRGPSRLRILQLRGVAKNHNSVMHLQHSIRSGGFRLRGGECHHGDLDQIGPAEPWTTLLIGHPSLALRWFRTRCIPGNRRRRGGGNEDCSTYPWFARRRRTCGGPWMVGSVCCTPDQFPGGLPVSCVSFIPRSHAYALDSIDDAKLMVLANAALSRVTFRRQLNTSDADGAVKLRPARTADSAPYAWKWASMRSSIG